MVVHYCSYASQPDIQISCDKSWTTPAWGPKNGKTTTPGVYLADDGRYYTFEKEKVTCLKCSKTAA